MPDLNPVATTRFFERALPSGGYIAIQVSPVRTLFGPVIMRGEVVVERRPEARRAGHRAPIAACAEGSATQEIVEALYPIATSDPFITDALARKVMVPIAPRRSRPLS